MNAFATQLQADPIQIEEFLRQWYTHGGPFQLTAIPAGGGRPFGQSFTDFAQAAQWASDTNANHNIYYHVNGGADTTGSGRLDKSEVTHLIGVVADIDPPKGADVTIGQAEVDRVAAQAVNDGVSLLIHSGRGRQVLVKFIEPIPANAESNARIEKIGKALQYRYDGDAVWNVDRIMKLPGTVAYPNADKAAAGYVPRRSEIIGGAQVTYAPETVEGYFVDELAAVETIETTPAAQVVGGGTSSFPIPEQRINELVDQIRLGINRSPHAHILTTTGIPDKNDPNALDPSDIWWHAMTIAARVTNNIDVAKAALLGLQFCSKTAVPDGYKTRAAKCEAEIDKRFGKCLIHVARQNAEQAAQKTTLEDLIDRVQTHPHNWADLIDEVAALDEVRRAEFFQAAKAVGGSMIPLTEFKKLVKAKAPKKDKKDPDAIVNAWMQKQTVTHADGVPYWVRNGLADPINGGEVTRQLRLLIHRETGQTFNAQWFQSKVETMIAYALDAPEDNRTVCTRAVRIDNTVYVDLGDSGGNVVKITPLGWTLCSRMNLPSILFVRSKTMRALPVPASPEHGNAWALRPFLSCSDADARLVICNAATWFWQAQEFSILKVNGGAGSGKSTFTALVGDLFHPLGPDGASESDTSIPKDFQSLMIQGVNHPLLMYGNLSGITREQADWIVKTATGARFETRALYTTDALAEFRMKRPVILNGIDEIDQFSDLNSRAIKITLDKRLKRRDIGKAHLRAEYEAARPVILSGIFNLIVQALATIDNAPLPPETVRFQDVARFMWALTGGAQLEGRTVYDDLALQVIAQRQDLVASDNIALALTTFIKSKNERRFTATNSELLNGTNSAHRVATGGYDGVCKTARGFGKWLARTKDDLEHVGIFIEPAKNLGPMRNERGWHFTVQENYH